ncbi:MAG: hypothetical protein LBE75_01295 [Burkholderiales bacterium]|jgi:hypothetical protein|nr:hypothetical protein [Burkholderiales bacterium]
MYEFIELGRRFRDLTEKEREDPALLIALGDLEPYAGIGWDSILQNWRVIVLAEAGSGKTREMKARAQLLSAVGKPAFFIPLEALQTTPLREYLAREQGEAERFDSWVADGSAEAWFFLDSVDELKLTLGTLDAALGRAAQALGTSRNRAHIIISCRPTDWRPVQDMETFVKQLPPPIISDAYRTKGAVDEFLAPFTERERQGNPRKAEFKTPEPIRCVVLEPLGRSQIEAFARARDLQNTKAFLQEIQRREAWTFARRPLDLDGLIQTWKVLGQLGTRRQQHETDVKNALCDNPERADSGVLSLEKAMDGAERLALAMLLTKTRTIRALEPIIVPDDRNSLNAQLILMDWSVEQVKALLRRSMFDPATYGRVRFHHRSVQEFLAAQRLDKLSRQGLPKHNLRRLLLADTYGEQALVPTMRPVAAWIAKNNPDIRREILAREPEVLVLYGDPESLPQDVRASLIKAYVATYSGGTWRGLEMPFAEIQRLAQPDIAPVINELWRLPHENEEVREFLLKLVWLGTIRDCSETAFEALMTPEFGDTLRIYAARAIVECGRKDLLRKAADDMLENVVGWPDRIVFTIAAELFPNVISVAELEQLIRRTPEPKRSLGGFSWALYQHVETLEPNSDAARFLRDMLARIVWDERQKSNWHYLQSKYYYVVPALSRLCAAQLAGQKKPGTALVRAAVIAHRFHGNQTLGRDEKNKLPSLIAQHPAVREDVFWVEVDVMDAITTELDNRKRLFEVTHENLMGGTQPEDWPWVLDNLRNYREPRMRRLIFHAAIALWTKGGHEKAGLDEIKGAVMDDSSLITDLEEISKPRAQKWLRKFGQSDK